MKQELFKEIYNNIHLDSKQKERILNCLEKENHKIQAKPQKRFHIPAITACACIILLAAVPVLAANTPVLDRITQAFALLNSHEAQLTEEQKNIYTKYGNILGNKIKLDSCTITLEAAVCDEILMCIPFSLEPEGEALPANKDIYGTMLYKKIQNEIGNLIFCFKNTEGRQDWEDYLGKFTILPSEIQEDGTLKGCYLITYDEREIIKPGVIMQVNLPDKQDSFTARETASEFTINKIAESYNIPFNKELLLSQGLYPATNMEISPLSLKIDGTKTKGKLGFMSNLFFYDITVELKDGTVVENLSTDPGSRESGNTYSIFQTFDSPVNIEDVAGIRIEGKDFNLWFPVEAE